MKNEAYNVMNIAYCANRCHLPFTCVSMYSLLTAGRGGRNLRILLAADEDVTEADLAPMYRLVSRFPGCALEVRWPLAATDRRFFWDETCIISPEAVQVAYFRLLLPELFAGENRCLYLDGDLVITRSITGLYDTPLDGACMAGVTDRLCLEAAQLSRLEKDWRIRPGFYINAGVILMNLEGMRATGGDKETLELAYNLPFRYLDQDVLNQVYQGKVLLLPKAYNVFPDDRPDDLEQLRSLLPEHAALFPEDALEDPAVIHYIGKKKPWAARGVCYEKAWHDAEEACARCLAQPKGTGIRETTMQTKADER